MNTDGRTRRMAEQESLAGATKGAFFPPSASVACGALLREDLNVYAYELSTGVPLLACYTNAQKVSGVTGGQAVLNNISINDITSHETARDAWVPNPTDWSDPISAFLRSHA